MDKERQEPQTDIIDIIYHWIENDGLSQEQRNGRAANRVINTIHNAYELKGGWEGWAQVEIANAIKSKHPGLTVTREDCVFEGNTQRSDLVLCRKGDSTRYIIELKCQLGTARNVDWIVKQVNEDAKKLEQKLRWDFRPAKCLAIGIAVTGEARDAIEAEFRAGRIWNKGIFCKNYQIYVFWVETEVGTVA